MQTVQLPLQRVANSDHTARVADGAGDPDVLAGANIGRHRVILSEFGLLIGPAGGNERCHCARHRGGYRAWAKGSASRHAAAMRAKAAVNLLKPVSYRFSVTHPTEVERRRTEITLTRYGKDGFNALGYSWQRSRGTDVADPRPTRKVPVSVYEFARRLRSV